MPILFIAYRPCHGYWGTVTVAGRVVYSVLYTMTEGACRAHLERWASQQRGK